MACASEPLTALYDGALTDPACMFTTDGGESTSVMAALPSCLDFENLNVVLHLLDRESEWSFYSVRSRCLIRLNYVVKGQTL